MEWKWDQAYSELTQLISFGFRHVNKKCNKLRIYLQTEWYIYELHVLPIPKNPLKPSQTPSQPQQSPSFHSQDFSLSASQWTVGCLLHHVLFLWGVAIMRWAVIVVVSFFVIFDGIKRSAPDFVVPEVALELVTTDIEKK